MKCIKCLLIVLYGLLVVNSYSQDFSNNKLLIIKSYNQENQAEKTIEFYSSLNNEELTSEELLAIGEAFYQVQKFKDATNLLLQANGKDDKCANLELACCYAMLNKPSFAVKYLENYLGLKDRLTISEIKTIEAFSNISSTKEWNELWKKDWFSANELLFNDALYEFRIENLEEAENKAKQIIRKRPSYHKAYSLLSDIYRENGKIEDALVNINSAIELKPKNPYYRLVKSELLYDLEKGKKALKEINEAISIDSTDINFYLLRVKIFLQLEKNEQAQQDLENILTYNESTEVYRVAGETYYSNEDYLQALKYYNKCLEIESLNPDLHIARGLVYYKSGANEFAEKDFSMALDFYPTKGEIYLYRALVRVNMKNYEKSCSDFHKARKFGYINAEEYIKRYCQR